MQGPPPALPTCLPNIRRTLSNPRLDAFQVSPSEDELDLLARYAWNVELCASLYAPLHILEVALRNSLHAALTKHHGGNPRWYELRHAFPREEDWKKAQGAVWSVEKITSRTAPDAPGRVIASLNFGFWTTLLTKAYGSPSSARRRWQPLWPDLVPIAFPHFPNPTGTKRDRQMLADRFDHIRKLRNRVSHHEPIWNGLPAQSALRRIPLNDQDNQVLEALGWIDPSLVRLVRLLSRFPTVHARGPAHYRSRLATLP